MHFTRNTIGMSIDDTEIVSVQPMEMPKVGDGATIYHYSDRSPATIIRVTSSGKTVFLQEDNYKRADNKGMSESQAYLYTQNRKGRKYACTLRADGKYRVSKSNERVIIGVRERYYDFST